MRRPTLLALSGGLGLAVVVGLVQLLRSQKPVNPPLQVPVVRAPEGVAALGQLEPAGDVRRLAAPISGFGGTPRVAQLLVAEGDPLRRGQVLARFDNRRQIQADLAGVQARLSSLAAEIKLQSREVERYSKVAAVGAASLVMLDDKRDELVRLQGQYQQAIAERSKLLADLDNSELRSPLDGLVLRVHTREGERPGSDGVLEVGASQAMQALIEVYESDINRVQLGQSVSLVSENGGFKGTLLGSVIAISPQVRQRQVLSTDPTGDADARVVEVRVQLNAASAQRVISLAGMKVIARFTPS
ncbi:MAG: efflux RND transporter periplasmic adaptor subunit [Synechococcus sp.]|nr:efflux RND transporter periplasmic adaptor subunit [Synechococcus sp.]